MVGITIRLRDTMVLRIPLYFRITVRTAVPCVRYPVGRIRRSVVTAVLSVLGIGARLTSLVSSIHSCVQLSAQHVARSVSVCTSCVNRRPVRCSTSRHKRLKRKSAELECLQLYTYTCFSCTVYTRHCTLKSGGRVAT